MPHFGAISNSDIVRARGSNTLIRNHLVSTKILARRFAQALPQELWKAPKNMNKEIH
jgi:hypothetical protein